MPLPRRIIAICSPLRQVDFTFGGFLFMDAAGVHAVFGRLKGDPHMFYARHECDVDDYVRARSEVEQLLAGLGCGNRNVGVGPGQRWSLAMEVPHLLRPATALLALLGRDVARQEVVSGRGHYEYCPAEVRPSGIPEIEPLCAPESELALSAASMAAALSDGAKAEFGECLASIGWAFQPAPGQPTVNLRRWYGAAAPAEPPAVLSALVRQLSPDGFRVLRQWLVAARVRRRDMHTPLADLRDNPVLRDACAWVSAHIQRLPEPRLALTALDLETLEQLKAFSIASVCSTPTTAGLAELYGDATWTLGPAEWADIHGSTRIYTSSVLPGPFLVKMVAILSDAVHAQYWKDHSHMFLDEVGQMVLVTAPEKHRPSVKQMKALLDAAQANPEQHGFTGRRMRAREKKTGPDRQTGGF